MKKEKAIRIVADVLDVRTGPEERRRVERTIKANNRLKGSKFLPNTINTQKYREPQPEKRLLI